MSSRTFLTFLLFFTISISGALGQQQPLVKDTNEVIRLNELFKIQRTQSPIQAFSFAKNALELAQQLNYAKGEATAYNNLGVYYRQKGDYDEALNYFKLALNLCDSINEREGTAKALSNIGNIYSINSDFENALSYYLRAQAIFEEIQQPYRTMQIMNNIGVIIGIPLTGDGIKSSKIKIFSGARTYRPSYTGITAISIIGIEKASFQFYGNTP